MPVPAFQVTHIDSAHGGLRQVKTPRHLTRGRTLAGFPDYLFKAFAEWRLGGQLLDLLHPHPAIRTSQPVYFHNHRRTIHAPRQVPDLPLAHSLHIVQAPTASATFKAPVNRLAPHPQLQCLRRFVQFVLIHPVPRPSQNRRPFFIRHLLSLAKNTIPLNRLYLASIHEFLRRAHISGRQS